MPAHAPYHAQLDKAEAAARRGDRTAALKALAAFSALTEAGPPDAGADAVARRIFRTLGRLPKAHKIPEDVASVTAFLAVLEANQDSPQHVLRMGWSEYYGPPGLQGTRISVRARALLNAGVEQAGHKDRRDGDIEGRSCRWTGQEVSVPGGPSNHPETPDQKAAMARACHGLYVILLEIATIADPWGFVWVERRRSAERVAEHFLDASLPVPDDVRAEARRPFSREEKLEADID